MLGEEGTDTAEEIPLPPLPTTPQQTLFSFFKTTTKNKPYTCTNIAKTKENLKASESEGEEILRCGRKKSRKKIVSEGESSQDVSSSQDTVSSQDVSSSQDSQTKNTKKLIFPTKEKDLGSLLPREIASNIEMVECTLVTPFPAINHINYSQQRKLPTSSRIRLRHYSEKVGNPSFQRLCNTMKSTCVTDMETTPKTRPIEEWLEMISQDFPEYPVKKTFQHYLTCQKTVISSNISKEQSSKTNVESLWQRDAKLKSLEDALAEKNRIEAEKEAENLRKKKEANSIKNLLSKKVEKKCRSRPERIVDAKDSERPDCENNPTEEYADNSENVGSRTKININGLFARTNKKREARKREKSSVLHQSLICDVNQPNKEPDITAKNDAAREQVAVETKSKDIRAMFTNVSRPSTVDLIKVTKKAPQVQVFDRDVPDHEINSKLMDSVDSEILVVSVPQLTDVVNTPTTDTHSKSKSDIRSFFDKPTYKMVVKEDCILTGKKSSSSAEKSTLDEKEDIVKCVDIEQESNVFPKDLDSDQTIRNQKRKFNSNETTQCKKIKISGETNDVIQIEDKDSKMEIIVGDIDKTPSKTTQIEKVNGRRFSLRRKKCQDDEVEESANIDSVNCVIDHKCEQVKNIDATLKEEVNDEPPTSVTEEDTGVCENKQTSQRENSDLKSEKTSVCEDKKPTPEENSSEPKSENEETPNVRRSSRRVKKPVNYCESSPSKSKTKHDKINENIEDNNWDEDEKKTKKKPEEKNKKKRESEQKSESEGEKCDAMDESVIIVDAKKAIARAMESLDNLTEHKVKRAKPTFEVVVNEETVNSVLTWTEKYQPVKPRFVAGDRDRIRDLFTWLNMWKVRHEAFVKKKAAKKRSQKNSDSESESSDDEDELLNTMLLVGPCGSGTTAAVHACATLMDFKVLELNATINRTGKRIFDAVAEAVVSHQVDKKINQVVAPKSSFFNEKPNRDATNSKGKKSKDDEMSLVLFEHVDVIFDEQDRGFWQGLSDLRQLSKRPIVLTANDPWTTVRDDTRDDVAVETIHLHRPTLDQLLPIMQIVCLLEHVYVSRDQLTQLIRTCRNDVRRVMTQLQFWLESGRQPMYKLWLERKHGKQGGMTTANNSFSDVADTSVSQIVNGNIDRITDKENSCVIIDVKVTSDTDEKSNIAEVSNDTLTRDEISIPNVDASSLFSISRKVDRLKFSMKQVEEQFPCNFSCSHHSFIKTKSNPNQDLYLNKLSNAIDSLSEIDSLLSGGHTLENKTDCYPWSSSLSSSLLDSWSKVSRVQPPYPIAECLSSVRVTTEDCYAQLCFNRELPSLKEKLSSEYVALRSKTRARMPTLTHVQHTYLSTDVLAYLNNICVSEEKKKCSTTGRRARRFLHYLDTIGMCLDSTVVQRLSTPLLS